MEKRGDISNWRRITRKDEKVCNLNTGSSKRKVKRKINGRGLKVPHKGTFFILNVFFLKSAIALARLTPMILWLGPGEGEAGGISEEAAVVVTGSTWTWTRALALGMEGKEYFKWQCVAVEKSIKLSNQLNVGGKNNKGSNMGGLCLDS